jgi:hypothetical protein
MKNKYKSLISKLEPYCISTPESFKNVKNSEFIKEISKDKFYNPLLTGSQPFIEKIFRMDQMAFGQQNMAMQRWVFFDCAVMPGFAFGFSLKGCDISDNDRRTLNITKNESFPVSMYIAIPMAEKGKWFGHNLSSLNDKLEEDLSGLGFLTKAVALDLFGIRTLVGATQWDSLALLLHKKFGPMKLLSALTPIHSKENTLCYQSEICSLEFNLTAQQSSPCEHVLFTPDMEQLRKLQTKIESGEEVVLQDVQLEEGRLKFLV